MKSKLLILVAVVGLCAGYVIAAEHPGMKMGETMDAAVVEGTEVAEVAAETANVAVEAAAEETEAVAEETETAVEEMEVSMNSTMDKAVEGEVAK